MTGVANMFGLDMIMIRIGGWDILVEWASIVSVRLTINLLNFFFNFCI